MGRLRRGSAEEPMLAADHGVRADGGFVFPHGLPWSIPVWDRYESAIAISDFSLWNSVPNVVRRRNVFVSSPVGRVCL